jgi:membrane protease YdiL (CAAX protease family)
MVPSGKLVALALGTQAALALVAAAGILLAGVAVPWGRPVDVLTGLAAALALGGLNWWALRRAPANWVVRDVRRIYGDLLVPLFAPLAPRAAVAIGVSAGVGEELFFRGLLQPLVGWPFASLLFGLAHVTDRGALGFAVWAALMGGALGGLLVVTGGLIAPMVAHGVYDVLALLYIQRTPPAAAGGGEGEGHA